MPLYLEYSIPGKSPNPSLCHICDRYDAAREICFAKAQPQLQARDVYIALEKQPATSSWQWRAAAAEAAADSAIEAAAAEAAAVAAKFITEVELADIAAVEHAMSPSQESKWLAKVEIRLDG